MTWSLHLSLISGLVENTLTGCSNCVKLIAYRMPAEWLRKAKFRNVTLQFDPLLMSTSAANIDPNQLIHDNYHWMLKLAESIIGDASLAEDVVQEALISALKGIREFENRSSLKTWLHRITTNQAIGKLRSLKRLSELSIDEYQPDFDALDCRIEPRWGQLLSPEQVLEKQCIETTISDAFSLLHESYQVMIRLRDVEGYSVAEVAEMLEMSESNVKVKLHRARAAFKKRLEIQLRDEEKVDE